MSKDSTKMKYVVAYLAGDEGDGVSSDWIPCYDMDDAINHKRRIQNQTSFGSITITKILERHDH